MNSSVALTWQEKVYRRINRRLKLREQEFEEIELLKLKTERLRNFRKKLLTEKCD